MKKIICKIFGHNKNGKKYSFHNFEDGRTSWGTLCPRCNTLLYCIKGYVNTEPSYICCTELSDQRECTKKELLKYPAEPTQIRNINT